MNLYLIMLLGSVITALVLQPFLLMLNWRHWRVYLHSSVWAMILATMIWWFIFWMSGVPWDVPWQHALKS